jgi:hypothetical protein
MVRVRAAESKVGTMNQQATLAAQTARQSDTRQKTFVDRLLRVLDAVAPQRELITRQIRPGGWRETVENESMWNDWLRVQEVHGGQQDRRDMQMKLDPVAGTVSWAQGVSAPAGTGVRTDNERRGGTVSGTSGVGGIVTALGPHLGAPSFGPPVPGELDD